MDFSQWSRPDLVKYLEFLLHSYRVVDAFWYLNVENTHGSAEADRINEQVWGRAAQLAARDLKKRFHLEKGGLANWAKAQKLYPWSTLAGYQYIEQENSVLVEVPSCPAQEARIKRGLGEYNCQGMHRAEFEGFAHEIDPRIQVRCLFAPPDPHPEDLYCRWRFSLGPDNP
jgi:hypothetical protein